MQIKDYESVVKLYKQRTFNPNSFKLYSRKETTFLKIYSENYATDLYMKWDLGIHLEMHQSLQHYERNDEDITHIKIVRMIVTKSQTFCISRKSPCDESKKDTQGFFLWLNVSSDNDKYLASS